MTYSIIGILASVILLTINRDVIWNHSGKTMPAALRNYREFLLGVLLYYITDMLWGILESKGLTKILFVDTAVYFLAMAAAVMLWTRYVVSYLEDKNAFGTFLFHVGWLFFVCETIVVIINFFLPILFWFDDAGGYHAGLARYVTLVIQIILFLLTAIYTLRITSKAEGSVRRRHMMIGLFGIAMVLLIALQIFYPLLPCYAMGYMLGTCVLHSFVVEDEKEEYRKELEENREALTDALAAAEHASKAKTAFLSNMSHEIRTPMNAIIGLNNIAMNDPTASEPVKEYLNQIGSSAQHLLGVINDILDMSRIESGRMTIKNEEFSFSKCLNQVNTIISGQCKDKGLSYDYQTKGHIDEYYVGDAMKLKQVLINILGNAVKFTPEGGDVQFVIEEGPQFNQKKTLKFTIRDTGIGMSEEFLPHLFEAFAQEDSSSTNIYGSTGLGMPITKSIVELMNGDIQVQSEKGKGTTFVVTITFGESTRMDSGAEGGDPDPQEMNLKAKRILLAEDVLINAEIISTILSMEDIQVEVAENGRIAIEMFRDHEPDYYDAILMDMRMPEMDGLEATRAIRSMDRSDAAAIPIIALTANAFEEDVQRSMQAGLNAHLSKPVEPDILFETLKRLIKV